MAWHTVLLFLYSFSFITGYYIIDDEDYSEGLTLPTEYYLKAERIDLLRDMKEPMEIWYSAEANRSRIDVYGGTVKRYYYWAEYSDNGDEGTVYTISPQTTKTVKNKLACYSKSISAEVQNHDAFPVEGNHTYKGNKEHEGRLVDVWEETEELDDESKTENTIYTVKGERDVDVPIQIVIKELDTLRGRLTKHIIFNYYYYEPLVCSEDLDAEKDMICEVTPTDFHGTLKVLHPAIDGDIDIAFNGFKEHHKKEYKNREDHRMRQQIFHDNWKRIVEHNQKDLGFKLAVNHLADYTAEEMRRMNGARRSALPDISVEFPYTEDEVAEITTKLPKEYDMRLEGFISPVKNQGMCGSCWAFSTTAAVEGALARSLDRVLDLSEQSLVDCAWSDFPEGNEGCEGGLPSKALRHVMNYGLPLDEDYGSYLAQNGYCHLENSTKVYKIRGFSMSTPLSENALKVALYKYGPVVVTMQTNTAFQLYSSGVFYDHECKYDRIDHAVTIVGYGVREGDSYWIVKNSFGEMWGEVGYMLLSSLNNNCFVLNEPYYPIV